MTRKGASKSGSKPEAGPEADEVVRPEKLLKPSECRGFMRKRLAEVFPEIVHGFVKEAKAGSCAHVKLANELLEKTAVKTAVRRGKGSAERMLEEWREG